MDASTLVPEFRAWPRPDDFASRLALRKARRLSQQALTDVTGIPLIQILR
jgi:hypothetical protein